MLELIAVTFIFIVIPLAIIGGAALWERLRDHDQPLDRR